MAKVVTIYCDICHVPCTNNHYRIDITKVERNPDAMIQASLTTAHTENEESVTYPDFIYLCEDCAHTYLGKLFYVLMDRGAKWVNVDEEFEDIE